MIVAAWISVAKSVESILALVAFLAVIVGLWWLARKGRAAQDAEVAKAEREKRHQTSD